jgi:hypothetical protein
LLLAAWQPNRPAKPQAIHTPRLAMPVLRAVLALVVCASLGRAGELRTLAGKTINGQLVSAGDQAVEFSTATGTIRVPAPQVLDVRLQADKPVPDVPRIDCELTDGTILRCKPEGLTIKGTSAELTLLSGFAVKVGLKDIAYFLRDAQKGPLRSKFQEILKKKVKSDRLLVLKGDKDAKKPDLDFILGTLAEADAQGERIQFRYPDGKTFKPRLARLQGLIFFRPNPELAQTVCQVHDNTGNLLMANKLNTDSAGFKVTTATGARIDLDKLAVTRLDYNINKLNFLSDLDPAEVTERSGSGLITRYRKDRNLDNDPIRIRGKAYPKGLSMHAYTELKYDLGGKYKEFSAVLGVDDQVAGNTHAQVTVECDGVKVFSQEIDRKTIKKLVLKVKDVQQLVLTVSSKNLLDLHDHVTFADAKVSQ